MSKQSVYEIITKRIIEQLEQGVVPWRIPWSKSGMARNWKSQRPYRGINAILLQPGEYLTFKQVQEAGGKVKKGAKSRIAIFWKFGKKDTDDDGEGTQKKFVMTRYYNVFHIDDTEGIESKTKDEDWNHDPIKEAENIVTSYENGPTIVFASGRAVYHPISDSVSIPPLNEYKHPEEYYSTFFHELAHSTGHKSRLSRKGITNYTGFGSESYSEEELIAEITAAMLCGVARIENTTLDNSAAYINSWLQRLKNDSRLIIKASSAAQKAADYIMGVETEYDDQS